MKKIIYLLVLFILCGCASFNEADATSQIDNLLNKLDVKEYIRPNNSTSLFSYYIPSDVQEFDADVNSSYLKYNDSDIILNLNISAIINNKYYPENVYKEEGFYKEENIFYKKNGVLDLINGNTSSYVLKIYKDDLYLIHFVTKEANIYASSNGIDLLNTIKKILIIASSIEIDEETIISTYSYKEVIDYEKKEIGLFDYVLPSNGYLNDLINSVDGEILNDNTDAEEESKQEQVDDEVIEDSNDNEE